MDNTDDFFAELLAAFRIEAMEHLDAIHDGLLALETMPPDVEKQQIIETVYRGAHSLKGASRAVDLTDIEALCQDAESLFAMLKRDELDLSPGLFDIMHRVFDTVNLLLTAPGTLPEETVPALVRAMTDLREGRVSVPSVGAAARLAASPAGAANVPTPLPTEALPVVGSQQDAAAQVSALVPSAARTSRAIELKTGLTGTIRVTADRLDTVLLAAEEMLAAKLTLAQRASDIQEAQARVREWAKVWAKAAPLLNQAQHTLAMATGGNGVAAQFQDFLAWQTAYLKSFTADLNLLLHAAESDARHIGDMVDDLLEDTKKLLMLPCSSLLRGFPKMVRDIAADLGKDIDLRMEGTTIELDKRVMEALKDPLLHLVRNSIDHGIELPEVRAGLGKPRQGSLRIAVAQVDSSNVEITVADDGAGIDLSRVKAAAIAAKYLTVDEAEGLDAQALVSYIFLSGISTSAIITDLSGRGLGMAIVRECVEEFGGTVQVDTVPQRGTTIRILVPVTHATFRGVMVTVVGQTFIVAISHVNRVWRLPHSDVKTVENRETLAIDGQAMALVHLADTLELPRKMETQLPEFLQVLVLEASGIRIAFLVDEVLHEQEVLVKRFGRPLSRVRNVAGATVLGSGQVVPILNIRDLVKSAARQTGLLRADTAAESEAAQTAHSSILVVEDSITSRMLLKGILETAGYQVTVAVDGVEGYTTLKTGHFDLVITDIEMPRLDGFALTAKIRAESAYANLPIILVTGRESREDRERGIDVGANAYIAKSSFDQTNLLETIQQLL